MTGKGKPLGFRTKGKGKKRKVYPLMPPSGRGRGSQFRVKASKIHSKRSLIARRTDEALLARITPSPEHWIRTPNRYDVKGVDTPKRVREIPKPMWERKAREEAIVSKAIGVTPFYKGPKTKLGIRQDLWKRYQSKYPKMRNVPSDYECVWDRNRGTLTIKNAKTGELAYYISNQSSDVKPYYEKGLRGEALAKAYAEHRAEELNKNYAQYGRFISSKAEKGKFGWRTSNLKTRQQLFLDDIEAGKIKVNSLKMSMHQAKALPPDSGYLRGVSKLIGFAGKEGKDVTAKDYYHRGLVVKITSDYDPDLSDDHNTWAVITKMKSPYHYEVQQEGSLKKKVIRDTDVKGWIGDLVTDYRGLGKERHKKEVIPIIKKALRGKIPVSEPSPKHIWKPDKFYPHRVVSMDKNPKLSVHLNRAKRGVRETEKNRKHYTPKDYKRVLTQQKQFLQSLSNIQKQNMGMATFVVRDRKGKVRYVNHVRIVGEDKDEKYPMRSTTYGVTKTGKLIASSGLLGIMGLVPPHREKDYKPLARREMRRGESYRAYRTRITRLEAKGYRLI